MFNNILSLSTISQRTIERPIFKTIANIYEKVTIGSYVFFNGYWIGCQKLVEIADDCLISDCYLLGTDSYNFKPNLRHARPRDKVATPITTEQNVGSGANATVIKGLKIRKNTFIGLGSLAHKSAPSDVVVIGNLQQIVKSSKVKTKDFEKPQSYRLLTYIY